MEEGYRLGISTLKRKVGADLLQMAGSRIANSTIYCGCGWRPDGDFELMHYAKSLYSSVAGAKMARSGRGA